MTEDWGGAQWVLLTYIAMRLSIKAVLPISLGRVKDWPTHIGEWLSDFLTFAVLLAILAWGDFF